MNFIFTEKAFRSKRPCLICQYATRRTGLAYGDIRDSSIGRENAYSSWTLLGKWQDLSSNIVQRNKVSNKILIQINKLTQKIYQNCSRKSSQKPHYSINLQKGQQSTKASILHYLSSINIPCSLFTKLLTHLEYHPETIMVTEFKQRENI